MKKIILSTYTFLPDIGGVATNTLTIAEAFIEKGYDVTIVTSTPERCEYDDQMKIVRSPSSLELFKLYIKADWILFSNLSVKLCWPVVFMKNKTALHHHSSSAFNRLKKNGIVSSVKRLIENRVISKSIHFVNSEFTKKDGGDFFEKLPTYVTYPIVQNTIITKHIIDRYSEKKNAIFVGRLEVEKGVLHLLQHIEIIKEILKVEELTLVGGGSLLSSLQKKNVKGVNYLGAVDLVTVNKLMEESAYVFVPSIWQEPFGMVALEGLASGAVVISSDRGGLPEAVGDTGILFDLESETSFRTALERAKIIRDGCLTSNFLSEYADLANTHMDQFSSDKVIDVIINAINDSDSKES